MPFDFTKTIDKLKESLKKDGMVDQLSTGENLVDISEDPEDYVVLPEWWKETFGVPGLQFNRINQIAGDSDTGKTSLALVAMRAAQEQGFGVVYIETEGKTAPQDLENAGIDPAGVMLVRTAITEEAWEGGFQALNGFFDDYPEDKLLFVFDSYGNTISMRDTEIDLRKDSQKPGGAAKVNRMGINKLIGLMQAHPVAVLIINYTYDNIGSVGKINAGGKALNFFSTITIQSQRMGWVEGLYGLSSTK